jgi:hypothetical protein
VALPMSEIEAVLHAASGGTNSKTQSDDGAYEQCHHASPYYEVVPAALVLGEMV